MQAQALRADPVQTPGCMNNANQFPKVERRIINGEELRGQIRRVRVRLVARIVRSTESIGMNEVNL